MWQLDFKCLVMCWKLLRIQRSLKYTLWTYVHDGMKDGDLIWFWFPEYGTVDAQVQCALLSWHITWMVLLLLCVSKYSMFSSPACRLLPLVYISFHLLTTFNLYLFSSCCQSLLRSHYVISSYSSLLISVITTFILLTFSALVIFPLPL